MQPGGSSWAGWAERGPRFLGSWAEGRVPAGSSLTAAPALSAAGWVPIAAPAPRQLLWGQIFSHAPGRGAWCPLRPSPGEPLAWINPNPLGQNLSAPACSNQRNAWHGTRASRANTPNLMHPPRCGAGAGFAPGGSQRLPLTLASGAERRKVPATGKVPPPAAHWGWWQGEDMAPAVPELFMSMGGGRGTAAAPGAGTGAGPGRAAAVRLHEIHLASGRAAAYL